MYASWAAESVTGKFLRAPNKSAPTPQWPDVHIDNECAKRRSVCIALLLLIRDLCLKRGAVVLTGAFSKGAEREPPWWIE